MQHTFGELWIQTCIGPSFLYDILCILTHTMEITGHIWMFYLHSAWLFCHQRFLFSVLELGARYDWQIMAPSTHCSVFSISTLCILNTHNHKSKLQVYRELNQEIGLKEYLEYVKGAPSRLFGPLSILGTLPVLLEQSWSWYTTTIMTHVPK